jgi:dihydroorotate dehydrogenase (fumarate)
MDLSTKYLGLDLKHPVVASPSPLSADLDGVLRLADAGAAAVVMASIYEEQIAAEEVRHAALTDQGANSQPEAAGYFPTHEDRGVLESRLEILRKASERAGVPVIASLNGQSDSGWVDFAHQLQQAGASAIELNIYRVPADSAETGAEVEESYTEIVRAVKHKVSIPVAVKIAPFFSSPANLATKLADAGADGLVLFNRFYEPDIDLKTLTPLVNLHLSAPYDIRVPLMWISLISSRFEGSIAATTGVWSGDEVVKYLLVGADVAMTASALVKFGPAHIGVLVSGLRDWMEQRGFASLDAFRGRLADNRRAFDAAALMRAEYRDILTAGYASVIR